MDAPRFRFQPRCVDLCQAYEFVVWDEVPDAVLIGEGYVQVFAELLLANV